MVSEKKSFVWNEEKSFDILGFGGYDETLCIQCNLKEFRRPLQLILPTLCITYADMKFANSIGGRQDDYPHSEKYGTQYFDPSIKIVGTRDVEKFTLIRNAQQVTVAADLTVIEWVSANTLEIPRLRISPGEIAKAVLTIADMPISIQSTILIDIWQLSDGWRVNDFRIQQQHPQFTPQTEEDYLSSI